MKLISYVCDLCNKAFTQPLNSVAATVAFDSSLHSYDVCNTCLQAWLAQFTNPAALGLAKIIPPPT